MTNPEDFAPAAPERDVEEADNRELEYDSNAETFDRITGDLQSDINDNFQEALTMHAKLNESYLGYKYTIHFPSSCEATIQPEMFPEDIQEKYRDEKLRLGKMDTLPTWIKKIGNSLRSSVTSSLLRCSSNTDTRFGYMVKIDSFQDVEAALLSIKGIDDSDRVTYDGTTIVSKAEELIETKRIRRSDWEILRDAPVTYREYITYLQENYEVLRAEIIAEYNRIFDPAVVDVIVSMVPAREVFFNARKIRFNWFRTQEIPSCVMQGNTTYRQVADRVSAGQELQHELQTIRDQEVESWKQHTLDSVSDIQRGVRSLIAEMIGRLQSRLEKTPMTDE